MSTVLAKAKPLWLTRTFAFNALGAALEIAQILLDAHVVDARTLMLIMAIGNVILRKITTQPATIRGETAKPVAAGQ